MDSEELLKGLRDHFSRLHPSIPVRDSRGLLPVHDHLTYRRVEMSQRKGFCFHHAAGWATTKIYATSHVKDRGWPGLGYTLVIHRDGQLEIAWDLDIRTYGQGWKDSPENPQTWGDENTLWIAVLVNGFFRSPDYQQAQGAGEPTVEQLNTVLQLIQWGRSDEVKLNHVTGHFEHGKPACPGTTLEYLIKAIQLNTPSDLLTSLDSVKDKQVTLTLLGYDPGPSDGRMGPRTREAIRRFQADAGIRVDGDWGPRTTAAMVEALSEYRRRIGESK